MRGKALKKNQVDWSVFFKAVVTIALPIALQNFLSTTASMVDTIMIGSQGELSVAAVGICSTFLTVFLLLFRICGRFSAVFFLNIGARGIIKGLIRPLEFP